MTARAKAAKLTAAAVKREVAALGDPEKAVFLQRFFRTGAGEYAAGDRMLGLTVPDQRGGGEGFSRDAAGGGGEAAGVKVP